MQRLYDVKVPSNRYKILTTNEITYLVDFGSNLLAIPLFCCGFLLKRKAYRIENANTKNMLIDVIETKERKPKYVLAIAILLGLSLTKATFSLSSVLEWYTSTISIITLVLVAILTLLFQVYKLNKAKHYISKAFDFEKHKIVYLRRKYDFSVKGTRRILLSLVVSAPIIFGMLLISAIEFISRKYLTSLVFYTSLCYLTVWINTEMGKTNGIMLEQYSMEEVN